MRPRHRLRTPFRDYYQEALAQLLRRGYTRGELESLRTEFGLLAPDTVTGFHEGRSGPGRKETLIRAVRHALEMGEATVYIAMDLQNLGGLNDRLTHSGANEVYREIAAIIRREFSAVASEAIFFRHGGDEMSAILVNIEMANVDVACAAVTTRVGRLAADRQLDVIPHGKHPDRPDLRGIGVHFGISRLGSRHQAEPTLAFKEADTRLEASKQQKLGLEDTLRRSSTIVVPNLNAEVQRFLGVCAAHGVAAVADEVLADRELLQSLAAACHRAGLPGAGWYLQYLNCPYD